MSAAIDSSNGGRIHASLNEISSSIGGALLGREGFGRLLKNSRERFVLKGRGFKPRRKFNQVNRGFSRCGVS